MGTIQSSINQGLGAIAGAVTTGKYIKDQVKSNELREAANELNKAELRLKLKNDEQAAFKAEQALNTNTLEINKEMIKDLDPEVSANTDMTEDQYLAFKQKQAGEVAAAAEKDFNDRKLKYEWGAQKTKPSSKRLDMAQKAFLEKKDAIMAREQLKFDYDVAKQKIDITKKALEGVK